MKGNREKTHMCPVCVILWMSYSCDDYFTTWKRRIFDLVHSLKSYAPPNYHYLPCWQGDSLEEDVCVIGFHRSVKSLVYVLPAVKPASGHAEHYKKRNFIRDNDFEDKYFVSVPPIVDWSNFDIDMG